MYPLCWESNSVLDNGVLPQTLLGVVYNMHYMDGSTFLNLKNFEFQNTFAPKSFRLKIVDL